jgi:hypothetical protein
MAADPYGIDLGIRNGVGTHDRGGPVSCSAACRWCLQDLGPDGTAEAARAWFAEHAPQTKFRNNVWKLVVAQLRRDQVPAPVETGPDIRIPAEPEGRDTVSLPAPDPLRDLRLIRDVIVQMGGFDRLEALVGQLRAVQVSTASGTPILPTSCNRPVR